MIIEAKSVIDLEHKWHDWVIQGMLANVVRLNDGLIPCLASPPAGPISLRMRLGRLENTQRQDYLTAGIDTFTLRMSGRNERTHSELRRRSKLRADSLSPGVPSQVISDVRHTEPIERFAVLGKHEIAVDDEDYVQPRELWSSVFDEVERKIWVENVSETLEAIPAELKQGVIVMFSKVDSHIGQMMIAKGKEVSHL